MTTLRITIVGTEELQRRLKKMDPGANQAILRKSFKESAGVMQADIAKVQIRGGRGDAPPDDDFLTNRHGGRGLAGSIGINFDPLPFAIEVGTHLAYGPVHEEGRGPYPVREFLKPALDKMAPKFEEIVVKHWKKEAGL
jgi:hypothetical protein